MEALDYYKKIYALQDNVLALFSHIESSFYLTGGTALHRFYYHERYSDDLDFFTNESKLFSYEYKDIRAGLNKSFKISDNIDTHGFKRIIVHEETIKLKIDFVNDIAFRVGNPVVKNNILIDNIPNMLTNKISAILGRDNPKDVFDIMTINRHYEIDWNEILTLTAHKISFDIDELIIRLKEFPVALLKKLTTIKKIDLNNCEKDLSIIIDKIHQMY